MMNPQVIVVQDTEETVKLFNRAKRALVKHFSDRPFEKYDQTARSANAYALNLAVGPREGKYNGKQLVPDVTFKEVLENVGKTSIMYGTPIRGPEDQGKPKWFKPCSTTISYCPTGWPGKNSKPEINVRVHNRDEIEGVVELMKKLGLKPEINDHELWIKVDIYASLCS